MAPSTKLRFYTVASADSYAYGELVELLGLPKHTRNVTVYTMASTIKEAMQHFADIRGIPTPRTGTVKVTESDSAYAMRDLGYLVERGTVLVRAGRESGLPDRLVRLTSDSMTLLGEWNYDKNLRTDVFTVKTQGDEKSGPETVRVLDKAGSS